MEQSTDFQCPWCGAPGTLVVDTGLPEQRMVTDCEVCCRPIAVVATCEPGEILSLEVSAD